LKWGQTTNLMIGEIKGTNRLRSKINLYGGENPDKKKIIPY